MAGTPGIAARVFSALASARINVVAIAQVFRAQHLLRGQNGGCGGSGAVRARGISALEDRWRTRAPVLRTDVVLLDSARRTRACRSDCRIERPPTEVRVVGLLDRSGYIFDPKGLSRRRLHDLAHKKDAGSPAFARRRQADAAEALTTMASHAASRPIIVDVTSEETGDLPCRARSWFQRRAGKQETARAVLGEVCVPRRADGKRRPAGEI